MTRINVVPVSELSDQWLIAEYRELPRVLKGSFSILGAPKQYKLNKGHIKWARYFGQFTSNRFNQIIQEMRYRGFKINFSSSLDPYLTKEINIFVYPKRLIVYIWCVCSIILFPNPVILI